jgi:hypothetical protein
MIKKINTGEIIKASWKMTSDNFLGLLGTLGIVVAINIILSVPNSIFENNKEMSLFVLVYSVAVSVFGVVIGMGLVRIILDVVSGQKIEFKKLFTTYKPFWKYLLSSILLSIIILTPLLVIFGLGMAGFLILGKSSGAMVAIGFFAIAAVAYLIYMSVRLAFNRYFVIDRNSGPLEAIKLSYKATKGQVIELIIFQLALFGINLLGALLLFVGLLFTIPLTMVASAMVYRQLASNIDPEQIATTEPVKTEDALAKIAAGEPVVQ